MAFQDGWGRPPTSKTRLARLEPIAVALPEDLKAALDRRAPSLPERNELVAAALRAYFAWPRPGEDASDLAVINANAKDLNAEAQDALSYQVPL